jgi:serine/threonine-protein kinase
MVPAGANVPADQGAGDSERPPDLVAEPLRKSSDSVLTQRLISFKYRLLLKLGEGGMAVVYLAVAHGPSEFRKLVVLKMLRADLSKEPSFTRMFMDEARLAAQLTHPNVVQTYEVSQDQGRYFIVMEHLDGVPLSAFMLKLRKKSPEDARVLPVQVLIDALAGLHHAHELRDFDASPLNLVHRDMSPNNVFVTFDGFSKVLDFGIAKAKGYGTRTRTGAVRGTVRYLSPEAITGDPMDRRSDIYSVGTMLWEIATGRRIWRGLPDVQILFRISFETVPLPSSVDPSVDPELERICLKAMARSPGERYGTCLEFRDDLVAWLTEKHGSATLSRIAESLKKHFGEHREEVRRMLDEELQYWARLAQSPVAIREIPLVPTLDTVTVSAARPVLIGARSKPNMAWWLGPTALAAAGGLALYAWSSSESATPPVGPSPQERLSAPANAVVSLTPSSAVAAPSATSSYTPSLGRVPITIKVSPASASVTWRGHLLASNPASFEEVASAQPVELVASASGFRARRMQVDISKPVVLNLQLTPLRTGAAATATGTGTKPNTPEPRDPRGARGLEVDRDNPWKQ